MSCCATDRRSTCAPCVRTTLDPSGHFSRSSRPSRSLFGSSVCRISTGSRPGRSTSTTPIAWRSSRRSAGRGRSSRTRPMPAWTRLGRRWRSWSRTPGRARGSPRFSSPTSRRSRTGTGSAAFIAEVCRSNHRMIEVFRESGFPLEMRSTPDAIMVELPTSLSAEAIRASRTAHGSLRSQLCATSSALAQWR